MLLNYGHGRSCVKYPNTIASCHEGGPSLGKDEKWSVWYSMTMTNDESPEIQVG